MNDSEIKEIIEYVNKKYSENVPRPVRFVVRKKAKMMEKFDPSEMPASLRKCTIEDYVEIVKNALHDGSLKL
ncbi:MAG: hypothetical protein GTN35_01990 [Nitrososphaeria archaeon]|nr:hypothetical protein [Nitrosopumilaceae archaeon]NIP09292.1 hypothetical protein [Nitrosopumilaceae archaeon]NIP91166.1 hypothetical protein [Nitrososphaeria archaeon]NIS94460.1 hypothetical protein [Nitrosopumilaceae archaeon]